MRIIKFRGKRIDNGEWVYGDLLKPHTGTRIVNYDESEPQPSVCRADFHYHNVDPATVGQFTGLRDKNGKEIYEGDIILCKGKHQYKVEWITDGFMMRGDRYGGITSIKSFLPIQSEIIGNIHNPELLNEK